MAIVENTWNYINNGKKPLTSHDSNDPLQDATSERQCCGACLHLYEKKGGKKVWLCKLNNDIRISDPNNKVCKSFVEKGDSAADDKSD